MVIVTPQRAALLPRTDMPVVDVQVGATPSYNIHAGATHIVAFHFPSNSTAGHSIVQTNFETPCTFQEQGFSSGPSPAPSSDFRIITQNYNAIYFACIQHCHLGEVGIIDASSDDQIEEFVSRAKTSTPDFSHVPAAPTPEGDGIFGGIVAGPPNEHEKNFPSWAIGVIVLGIVAAFCAITYVLYRLWLRLRMKDLAEWRAMRDLRGDGDNDPTLVESAREHAARANAML